MKKKTKTRLFAEKTFPYVVVSRNLIEDEGQDKMFTAYDALGGGWLPYSISSMSDPRCMWTMTTDGGRPVFFLKREEDAIYCRMMFN